MKPPIPLNQCRLFRCRSKRALAERLEISMEQLSGLSEWRTYRTFEQEKASIPNETRTIYAPGNKLKAVQRRIQRLIQRIEKPSWVYSGTKGVCHVDNAFSHAGGSYFVLTDISSFYDHCTRDAVYRFFLNDLECAPDVADLLASMTTCENSDGLSLVPTGSPCSQLIAYFAYRKMLDEIYELAKRYGCRFSLYVDDLTISSTKPIGNPKNLEKQIARILKAYGHEIKWRKTGYYGRNKYKLITGVALDGEGIPKIPNHLGENIVKGMRKALEGDEGILAPTFGRIGAARQIVNGAFPEVVHVLATCQERQAIASS